MKMRFKEPPSPKIVIASTLAIFFSSCAIFRSNVIQPVAEAPSAPEVRSVPNYAGVPHPLGLQIGDVNALFVSPDAPKRESPEIKECTAQYRALENKTKSRDELKQGILELVRKDPVRYHWCFYSEIIELEYVLRGAELLDERQRAVVEAFRFLAPLSRAFFREFHDSRYLRWAVSYYRKASELAFYRRVEGSPALTEELIGIGGDETTRGIPEHATSVLEKYGISAPAPLMPDRKSEEGNGEALPSDAFVKTDSGVLDEPKPVLETNREPATEPDSSASSPPPN